MIEIGEAVLGAALGAGLGSAAGIAARKLVGGWRCERHEQLARVERVEPETGEEIDDDDE